MGDLHRKIDLIHYYILGPLEEAIFLLISADSRGGGFYKVVLFQIFNDGIKLPRSRVN
jgi:hypothetical protein